MGCMMSAPKDENASPVIRNQRRRLSVAPTHVGGIDKADQRISKKRDSVTAVDLLARETKNMAIDQKEKIHQAPAALTKKGFVPYNRDKKNQDAYIVKLSLCGDPDIDLFGAFDGHGEWGHKVSTFVKARLAGFLETEPSLKTDPPKAILSATRRLCKQLDCSAINCQLSGTTAVYTVRVKDVFFTANIGDSRCIIGRRDQDGKVKPIELSFDHKPDNPIEHDRIIKAGGRVQTLPGNPDEDCGPPRVWLADMMVPGLAMSRSIGDKVSHRVGVLDIPEITEHKLHPDDLFAIWASDGVWEFLSNLDTTTIVNRFTPNWKKACAAVVDESNQQWKENEEVVDDITVVIVGLQSYIK